MKSFLFLILLFLANSAFSIDVIFMANGDKISGSIIEMSKEFMIIETDYGSLKINRSYVAKAELSPSSEQTTGSNTLLLEYLFNNNFNNSSSFIVEQKIYGKSNFAVDLKNRAYGCLENSDQDSYIVINSTNHLESYDDFSISFWIYPTDPKRTQYIFSQWNSTKENKADGKLALSFMNDILIIYLVSSDGIYHTYTIPKTIDYNSWQSVLVYKNKSTLEIFKNKKKIKAFNLSYQKLYSTKAQIVLLTAKFNSNDFSSYNFRGKIDQLQLFNKAISEKEIEDPGIMDDF